MKTNTLQKNIPSGWRSAFVDNVCYVMKGSGLSKKFIDPSGKNKCILYGELFTTYDEVIENVKSRTNSTEGTPSVNGDILIPGSTTTVARDLAIASALNEDGVLLGGDINILRKKDDFYDPNFLAYYLTHYKKDEIGKLGQGTTIVHLYGSNIKDLEVVIPKNIKEQQKIAEILGTVDEDIAKTQEVIGATEKLKRGLMQQLFTRGIGHTKFKETKIGRIPEGWSLVQIKDAPIKIADGNYSAKYPRQDEFMEEGIPFVRVNNLQDQTLVKEDLKYISVEKHSELKKGHLKTDDVLITTRGRLGVIALVPSEFNDANINAQIVLLRADNKNLLSKFLMYFLLSPEFQSQVFSGGSGSALQQLPVRVLENTYIPLPSPKEQLEIAEIFSSVDEKILVNKKLKAKLTLLKKGLMQDLLSGKVRTK